MPFFRKMFSKKGESAKSSSRDKEQCTGENRETDHVKSARKALGRHLEQKKSRDEDFDIGSTAGTRGVTQDFQAFLDIEYPSTDVDIIAFESPRHKSKHLDNQNVAKPSQKKNGTEDQNETAGNWSESLTF